MVCMIKPQTMVLDPLLATDAEYNNLPMHDLKW